jgi:hypothetical protein
MANFSTEFPIENKNSVANVLALACEWLTGSPHTKIQKSDLQNFPVDSETTISTGTESVTLATAKERDFEIGGMRYIKIEDQFEWTTSIVCLKTHDSHVLSMQVICEALGTSTRIPPPKKPYFIRQAITKLGGGADGEIPVADRPIELSDGEEHIAAELINGTANNKLPIVYVSAGFKGNHFVDPKELARFVSGMAHVIVEPSRSFSLRVRQQTRSRNVFGGAIGVYWPESSARSIYFPDDTKPNPRSLHLEIAKDIRVALSNRRQRNNCTWARLTETIARKHFDQLKSSGSTALQEYIDVFDTDIAAKNARLEEAEHEIGRLTAEVKRLSNANDSSTQGIISAGKEQDLYEREISDIILDALDTAMRNSNPTGRRHHILNDLISANLRHGERERLEEEIKTLFKTYQSMDARTRSALTKIGFDLSEDGKHYKAIFQGDGRYTFSLPKTSSDHRAGKNMASDINNAIFR